MLVLFLDDSQKRVDVAIDHFEEETLCIAMDAETAIRYLAVAEEPWDLVMLDHDLGDHVFQDSNEENTGMEVVRYIEFNLPKIKRIIVHSWNPGAGREMEQRLTKLGYPTTYAPFEV